MDDIELKVEGLLHDMVSLTRRVQMCEDTAKTIQDLLISVQQLANSVEHLVKEQAAQSERIKALEQGPKEKHDRIWQTIVTAAISCGVTAFIARIIALL